MSELNVSILRKKGKLNEAYARANANMELKPGYLPFIEDVLWVYYDFAKRVVIANNPKNMKRIISKVCELKYLENQMFNESLNWQIVKLMNNKELIKYNSNDLIDVLKTCNTFIIKQKPSLSKSVLIKSMIRVLKNDDNAWSMLGFLDENHFREDDFRSEEYKGKKMMPLFEQLIYAYTKSWLKAAKEDGSVAIASADLLLATLKNMEKNKHYRFVLFYKAKVNLVLKNKDDAYSNAKKFLETSLSQSYAWALLSSCSSIVDDQISFLSKAILLQKEEKFSLGARQSLMNIFSEQKDSEMLNFLATSIIKTRRDNKWPVPNSLYQWLYTEVGGEQVKEAQTMLNAYASSAIENSFKDAKTTMAIITSAIPNNKLYFAVDTMGVTHRFKWKKPLAIGQFVQLIHNQKILELKPMQEPSTLEGAIRKFVGNLKIIKDFGFVKNVFISPKLAQGLNNGEAYYGWAIEELNKKTNKKSWRAISLKKNSQQP